MKMFEITKLKLGCASRMRHFKFWMRWDLRLTFLDLTLYAQGQTLNSHP